MKQTVVLNLPPDKIRAMQQTYRSALKPKTPAYAVFSASVDGVTITAYQSGKVVFQGLNAEGIAKTWGTAEKKPAAAAKQSPLPKNFASWNVIGSDEVGNGSYFGPVVVCACYVTKEQMPLLKELGVKDSKELSDSSIRSIASDLVHVVPYQELIVTPEKYNQIQPEYNVNRMKVALHNQAIHLLLNKIAPVKPDAILIDQFTPEANYRNYLKKEKHPVTDNLYFATKGEQYHLSVAAASIICRTRFLEALDTAGSELGFTVPSGAGKQSDLTAARILKRGGTALLGRYAKLHFANTEKAKKLLPGSGY